MKPPYAYDFKTPVSVSLSTFHKNTYGIARLEGAGNAQTKEGCQRFNHTKDALLHGDDQRDLTKKAACGSLFFTLTSTWPQSQHPQCRVMDCHACFVLFQAYRCLP